MKKIKLIKVLFLLSALILISTVMVILIKGGQVSLSADKKAGVILDADMKVNDKDEAANKDDIKDNADIEVIGTVKDVNIADTKGNNSSSPSKNQDIASSTGNASGSDKQAGVDDENKLMPDGIDTTEIGEGDTTETGDVDTSSTGEGNTTETGDGDNSSTGEGNASGTEVKDNPILGNGNEAVTDNEEITVDVYDTITISAAGDVTLGRDLNFGWEKTFDHELELQNGDFSYFFRNVKDIFEADDLTIVNLETTLTTANKAAEKKFRFKADPSYVEILKEGSIEAVSIANNHTLDYLEKGYKDTLATLKEAEVGYFGYEHRYITEIRGIKIGVLGFVCWEVKDKQKEEIKNAIAKLKEDGADLVIVMFHWGIERDYWPNNVQKKLSRFAIDNGADLVLGAHPHVVQGIEEYKGKQIVYSLGNFCFGGNKNPKDKDTFVYIHKFNFKNKELISEENEVIPCSISSVTNRNNYQPTPLKDKEGDRVMKKIKKYSDF